MLTSGIVNPGVILDEEGNLYGTTFDDAVFKLDRNGQMTVLNSTSAPATGPVRDAAGNLITATSRVRLDLRITTNPVQPTAGQSMTYTFKVRNRGPHAAINEMLTATVPFSFTGVSTSGTPGLSSCTHPPVGQSGIVVCEEGGRMRAGNTWTVQVTVLIPAGESGSIPEEAIASAKRSNQQTVSILTVLA